MLKFRILESLESNTSLTNWRAWSGRVQRLAAAKFKFEHLPVEPQRSNFLLPNGVVEIASLVDTLGLAGARARKRIGMAHKPKRVVPSKAATLMFDPLGADIGHEKSRLEKGNVRTGADYRRTSCAAAASDCRLIWKRGSLR